MRQLAFLRMFMLVAAINRHWDFINEQVTKTFNGEKTIAIDL